MEKIVREVFQTKRVLIVGDVVADQFLHGTIARVSREAPVFILRHDETQTLAGGAANAAVNVASLGGKSTIIGLIGDDLHGQKLLQSLAQANVNCDFIVTDSQIQTTTKVRVLAGQHYANRQQVIRIDYENQTALSPKVKNQIKENFLRAVRETDALIVSDYNYGVIDSELFSIISETAETLSIPLLVDSRFRLNDFRKATSATPNQEEVEQLLGENFTLEDCLKLRQTLRLEALLITRGNKGMLLLEAGKEPLEIEIVGSQEPVDVTGAGDTVIAAFTLGLASGLNFADSARLANHAGGIVVMKKGTASVSQEELLNSLQKNER